jgi:beta-catenin-like protein 1
MVYPEKRVASDALSGVPPAKRINLDETLPDEITAQEIEERLDEADKLHIEALTEGSLKRMVMQFERKIQFNQEMRIKHADEPDKFLKTEVDLDEQVKKFTQLATHPELYPDFIRSDALPSLVGLLNHANTDIAVDVFQVLSELTDPDVIAEVENPETFLSSVFEAQLCQSTVDVLMRINEDDSDEDAQAVTNCMTMIEHLAEMNPAETARQFSSTPKFLPWLIKRVRAPGAVDYNRVYASEILGIVLQNSATSREAMVRLDGVDKLLRGIAVYRKRDPADSEESEFMQNMFDCLCSLMLLPAHQLAFGKVQGVELMIRMMREQIFATNLAFRLTDHALRHCAPNCQIFVDKLGLKVLFARFMKKGPRLKSRSAMRELDEHVTSIIHSLCRYCTGTAVARVLNKFTENRFEKLERLLEMHEEYAQAVREADAARLSGQLKKIDHELEVDEEEQLFLDRCDAGLFTLQQLDVVLVRLGNMGNIQATEEIGKLLNSKGVPLSEVCSTIEEYCAHLDDSANSEIDEIRSFTKALVKRCGGNVETLCPEPKPKTAPTAKG